MTNPPYDSNQGGGAGPWAVPTNDTPQQGHPQPGYPQPGYPQQSGYPQGLYGAAPYGVIPGPYGYGPSAIQLASWGARVAATLIDGLIMSPVLIIGYFALYKSIKPATYNLKGNLVSLGGPTGTGVAVELLCDLVVFAFSLWQLYRQGTTGQTIGKKAIGIRILKQATMQPTGFGLAFVRSLAHILDALPCYVGFLAPLWDSGNRTFADQICGTLAVKN